MKTPITNKLLILLMSGMALTFVSCNNNKSNEEATAENAMSDETVKEPMDKTAYENNQKKYSSELDEINAKYPNVYYVYYSDPNGWYKTNHGNYSVRVYGLDKDAELSKRYNEALRNRYNDRATYHENTAKVYTSTAMPKDGYDKLYETLSTRIKYPEAATSTTIGGGDEQLPEGTVMVGFTVDATGAVKDVHVIDGTITAESGVRDAFYKEATDAIQSTSGMWTPATQNGQNADVELEIPISFKADKV